MAAMCAFRGDSVHSLNATSASSLSAPHACHILRFLYTGLSAFSALVQRFWGLCCHHIDANVIYRYVQMNCVTYNTIIPK